MPAAAAAALSLLAGCRSPPDDLQGQWAGALACAEGDLAYGTDVALVLDAPTDGRHPGTLALVAAWTGDDGVAQVQRTDWSVILRQEFPKGAQDVDFVQADCTAAERVGADGTTLEGCGELGRGIGTSSLAWDGADTLRWSGSCEGSLARGAEIPGDDTGAPDAR
jgi:hypothetical protein